MPVRVYGNTQLRGKRYYDDVSTSSLDTMNKEDDLQDSNIGSDSELPDSAYVELAPNESTRPHLPCPARIPGDITIGSLISVWFGNPYNDWYDGTITDISSSSSTTTNASADFEGDICQLELRRETYKRAWILPGIHSNIQ